MRRTSGRPAGSARAIGSRPRHRHPGRPSTPACDRSRAVPLVPSDRASQAILERRVRQEAEALPSPGGVQCPAWLAVGFGGVPADLALEPAQARDRLDQLADGDLVADAEVDRLVPLLTLPPPAHPPPPLLPPPE